MGAHGPSLRCQLDGVNPLPPAVPSPPLDAARLALLAHWRKRVTRRRAKRTDPPPPLVPGLPILWSPSIVVSALRERLQLVGLDRPETVAAACAALGIVSPAPGSFLIPCPTCRVLRARLWYRAPARAFLGGCCLPPADVPYLARAAAAYTFACRVGGARAGERRRAIAARLALRQGGSRSTPGEAARARRISTALAARPPARLEGPRPAAGPIATALAADVAHLVVHAALAPDAYLAVVAAELAAEKPATDCR